MTTTTIPLRIPRTSRPTVRRPTGPRPAPPRRPAAARQAVAARGSARRPAAVYRRRRAITAVCGALFVLAGARAADAVVADGTRHVRDTSTVVHYHVQPGDTLWSIAHRLAPGSDPRAVVDLLVQAHGGSTIQPGDVIDWAGT